MIVKRKHYDVIHCHILQGFHSAAAVIAGRMFKKKVAIKVASTGATSDFNQIKQVLGGRAILRFLRKTAQLVVTSKQSVVEAQMEGFPESRIVMIPNGVDAVRFKPSAGSVGSRTRIVCVGRLIKGKGVDALIDAFIQLQRKGLCRRLDIVGDGPEHSVLAAKAAQSGCAEDIMFHGEVDNVETFFDTTSIFVQPSLSEGMSNVILEAMASGLPVIATRTGAAMDIIQDCENGMLVDAGSSGQIRDAIKKIASDDSFAQSLGSNARKTIQDSYSIDIVARRYLELYSELISS